MAFFRVAALDLDGTLTSRGTVSGAALEAIDGARENGLLVLLVTGRIGAELEAEFPGLTDHFDGLVLENGAVAVTGGRARPLAL
ncbi:MAG TPA: HAD hydrolase family protein, partial [Nocardioidaceae bacterium]